MKFKYLVSLVVAWLVTANGQAAVGPAAEVKLAGERVHIQASVTPLTAILDRLSKATGMKVVYEGAPPSDRLTANIDAGSETEALSRLLEGLGLTYAFKLDASGRHVETLFLTHSASSGARRASSSSPSSSQPPPAMMNSSGDEDVDDEGVSIEPLPNEPDPTTFSQPQGQPGMPNGMIPGTPGFVGGVPGVSGDGSAAPEPQNPSFPGAASFPSPNPTQPFPTSPFPAAPFPTPPGAPGPASFPTPNLHS